MRNYNQIYRAIRKANTYHTEALKSFLNFYGPLTALGWSTVTGVLLRSPMFTESKASSRKKSSSCSSSSPSKDPDTPLLLLPLVVSAVWFELPSSGMCGVLYGVRYFWRSVPNFNESKASLFFASGWLKFGTLPRNTYFYHLLNLLAYKIKYVRTLSSTEATVPSYHTQKEDERLVKRQELSRRESLLTRGKEKSSSDFGSTKQMSFSRLSYVQHSAVMIL